MLEELLKKLMSANLKSDVKNTFSKEDTIKSVLTGCASFPCHVVDTFEELIGGLFSSVKKTITLPSVKWTEVNNLFKKPSWWTYSKKNDNFTGIVKGGALRKTYKRRGKSRKNKKSNRRRNSRR
jgi:hypothetical protein